MKTITQLILIFIILLPIQLLSQVENERKTNRMQLLQERIKSKFNPPKQLRRPLGSDHFLNKESRTIINKPLQHNGFLLDTWTEQNWIIEDWIKLNM